MLISWKESEWLCCNKSIMSTWVFFKLSIFHQCRQCKSQNHNSCRRSLSRTPRSHPRSIMTTTNRQVKQDSKTSACDPDAASLVKVLITFGGQYVIHWWRQTYPFHIFFDSEIRCTPFQSRIHRFIVFKPGRWCQYRQDNDDNDTISIKNNICDFVYKRCDSPLVILDVLKMFTLLFFLH